MKAFGVFGVVVLALAGAFLYAAKALLRSKDEQIVAHKDLAKALAVDAKKEREDATRVMEGLKAILQERMRVDVERGAALEKMTATLALLASEVANIRHQVDQFTMMIWGGTDVHTFLRRNPAASTGDDS